ncbi:hypothetical protein H100_04766 [Trichophyton rubrum MR850]|uniref:Uncharacterized protein n=1 Tax=Trichophyton rubrum (strain ATCC MYA-4607 / CBS 118892) TaxID=559305 RepID=F2SNL4_TRIRC|nr:uncharacterized protein TERG_04522 [Trichophyton rubrum CBS 118892]EGD88275.2 hypothetical protein TERG_04522 [Trichophyton rubrum CBS 118892]EZF22302.1 hypothetical protein H100_04766 [Trichophyton rubrum MR850]
MGRWSDRGAGSALPQGASPAFKYLQRFRLSSPHNSFGVANCRSPEPTSMAYRHLSIYGIKFLELEVINHGGGPAHCQVKLLTSRICRDNFMASG